MMQTEMSVSLQGACRTLLGENALGFLAATCPTKQGTFEPSEIELAKSEAVTQESLGVALGIWPPRRA
jgi:hypothetical protein